MVWRQRYFFWEPIVFPLVLSFIDSKMFEIYRVRLTKTRVYAIIIQRIHSHTQSIASYFYRRRRIPCRLIRVNNNTPPNNTTSSPFVCWVHHLSPMGRIFFHNQHYNNRLMKYWNSRDHNLIQVELGTYRINIRMFYEIMHSSLRSKLNSLSLCLV